VQFLRDAGSCVIECSLSFLPQSGYILRRRRRRRHHHRFSRCCTPPNKRCKARLSPARPLDSERVYPEHHTPGIYTYAEHTGCVAEGWLLLLLRVIFTQLRETRLDHGSCWFSSSSFLHDLFLVPIRQSSAKPCGVLPSKRGSGVGGGWRAGARTARQSANKVQIAIPTPQILDSTGLDATSQRAVMASVQQQNSLGHGTKRIGGGDGDRVLLCVYSPETAGLVIYVESECICSALRARNGPFSPQPLASRRGRFPRDTRILEHIWCDSHSPSGQICALRRGRRHHTPACICFGRIFFARSRSKYHTYRHKAIVNHKSPNGIATVCALRRCPGVQRLDAGCSRLHGGECRGQGGE
jgi:hypothetical protein